MKQELYLIRHGESEMNVNHRFIGGRSNHTPLTETGVLQAKQLGQYFLKENILPDRIFISPALRTIQTAEYVLNPLNLTVEPVIVDEIQEMDQGLSTGKERKSVYTSDVLKEIEKQGKDFKLPGGESLNDVSDRMQRWLNSVTSEETFERTFVFGHGLAIRSLVASFYDWPRQKILETATFNTSITLLSRTDQGWDLEYVGQVPHLVENN